MARGDFLSNAILGVTKQPRRLAGTLGVGNPEGYLSPSEQETARQTQDFLLNLLVDYTKPFAKGANILASGYGDLHRGLSGNTNYVSPLEDYIRGGVTKEEQGRIQDNPYREIAKSGTGMIAALMPWATGGLGTLQYSQNPLTNKALQYGLRGGVPGGLTGYSHSEEGKELQGTLLGTGIGAAGSLAAGYAFDPEFREMVRGGFNPQVADSQITGLMREARNYKSPEEFVKAQTSFKPTKDDYVLVYHNTPSKNVDSILKSGLNAKGGPESNPGYNWLTTEPYSGYGGNTIIVQIPKADAAKYLVNDTEILRPGVIPKEDIIGVDKFVASGIGKESDILSKLAKGEIDISREKFVEVLSKQSPQYGKSNAAALYDKAMELVETWRRVQGK